MAGCMQAPHLPAEMALVYIYCSRTTIFFFFICLFKLPVYDAVLSEWRGILHPYCPPTSQWAREGGCTHCLQFWPPGLLIIGLECILVYLDHWVPSWTAIQSSTTSFLFSYPVYIGIPTIRNNFLF